MPTRLRHILVEIISALLILLFVYTAFTKFLNFEEFAKDMNNQPFPKWITASLIWTVPGIEIITATVLLFEKTKIIGLWFSFVLMSLFTIYTATVLLHFFRYIPCSCGGVIKNLSWKQHMFLNLFFVGISITAILLDKRRWKKHEPEKSQQVVFT